MPSAPPRPPHVRAATPADDAAILRVVDAAFSDPTRDAHEELDIVRATWERRDGRHRIELVADDADGSDDGRAAGGETATVVGHVLAATGDVGGHAVAGVAPLSVAPARQRSGIGSALMDAVAEEAARRGWPVLVLLGDPAYYGRHGFGPAAALGIHYAPVGRDSPNFLARRIGDPGAALPRGEYRYCWEL